MLTMLQKRINSEEDGFTLIELMVVILIIAILMAIAIPTFLGAQDKAKDRAAQSNLRNALTAAKVIATDNAGLFYSTGTTPIVAADMILAEPSLSFAAASAVGSKVIGVAVPAGGATVTLETVSANGHVFGISATSGGAVTYCKNITSGAAVGNCDTAGENGAPSW